MKNEKRNEVSKEICGKSIFGNLLFIPIYSVYTNTNKKSMIGEIQ